MKHEAEPQPLTGYEQLHLHTTCKGHKNAVTSVQFSPVDDVLATVSADASVRLWRVEDGAATGPSNSMAHAAGVNDVSWNAQGNYLATASDDLTAKIWDAETGKCLCTLVNHTNHVFCAQFKPMGNILATGSCDETICFWDVRTARCIRELPAHSDPVTYMDFSHDGTILASCSYDGLVRLWDTSNGHCLKTLAINEGSSPLTCVKFSPNGRYILQASLDSKLRLVNYENGKVLKTYSGHINPKYTSIMTFVTTIGDRPSIAAGSEDGGLVFWDVNSRQVVHRISGLVQLDVDVQMEDAPDAQPAAAAATAAEADRAPAVDTAAIAAAEGAAVGHTGQVLCVAAHPSKPLLASAANHPDCVVKIWSAGRKDS